MLKVLPLIALTFFMVVALPIILPLYVSAKNRNGFWVARNVAVDPAPVRDLLLNELDRDSPVVKLEITDYAGDIDVVQNGAVVRVRFTDEVHSRERVDYRHDIRSCDKRVHRINWKMMQRIVKRAAKQHKLVDATLVYVALECRDRYYRWSVAFKEGEEDAPGKRETLLFDEDGEPQAFPF